MVIRYKEKCCKCRKNFVTVTNRQRYVVCYDCQVKDLSGEITDPDMKQLFDIPEQYYRENSFLRNIKVSYLRYRNLTDKQVEAFRKTVEQVKEELAHKDDQ